MVDSWARGWTVHQLIVGAVPGDAIADQAFQLRDWLREAGAKSEIYAERIHEKLTGQVRHFRRCRVDPSRRERMLFHYSIGSDLSPFVRRQPGPIFMMYHNITPAEYFQGADPETLAAIELGRKDLASFANVGFAFANSEFSRRELETAGYEKTAVLPLALDPRRFGHQPDRGVLARYADPRTNLLFVGSMKPNKKHEDVIKAFASYRRIDPEARLFLVGGGFTASYQTWLERFARSLRLDNVVFTGHVSDSQLVAYYQLADVFVCLSEHEGFGVPLVEAMASGVPVLAYASSAVPDTLGDAGILVHRKTYPVIAETIALMVKEGALRDQLIEAGRARAACFSPQAIRARFREQFAPLLAS